jgi:hypothetical protein
MILAKKTGVILHKFIVNLGKKTWVNPAMFYWVVHPVVDMIIYLEDHPVLMGKDFWTEQGKQYCYKNSVL